MRTETFNSSTTWECPQYVNTVRSDATGGGAGARASTVAARPGAGGGANAVSDLAVVPTTVYTVTVGTGGPGGTGNYNGAAGNDSWFMSITDCLAKGGQLPTSNVNGALGGDAASCVGNVSTNSGGNGGNINGTSGGGGGEAASAGQGGANGVLSVAGTGNPGGDGGAGSPTTVNGNPGVAPGGGGGAGGSGGTTSGSGATGRVTLTYAFEPPASDTLELEDGCSCTISVNKEISESLGLGQEAECEHISSESPAMFFIVRKRFKRRLK